VTVVSACYNEAPTLPILAERTLKALDEAGVEGRLLIVDDGSVDESPAVLAQLAAEEPRFCFLRLSRNFGQQAAISAGLDHAVGDAVVLLDGDLQDPPELIPEFIERFRAGYDVVYGVRQNRKEPAWKRAAYRFFYSLMSNLADLDLPQHAGDFGLMSRRVVDVMSASGERHRFLRGLRRWAGFRQTGVAYDRPARSEGEPKYTVRKLIGLGMDGLIAFSSAPLRAAMLIGTVTMAGAVLYILFSLLARLFGGPVPPGWTSIVAAVLGMGGIQLIMLGVIGEYIGRIYDETKRRPIYVVAEAQNVSGEPPSKALGVALGSSDPGA
jgi:dolichol-phosphate mannosyltransferase